MRRLDTKSWEFLASVGLVLVVIALAYWRSDPIWLNHPDFKPPFDRVWYYQMAEGIPPFEPPFRWRLGMPWLAGISPLGSEATFWWMTLIAFVLTGFAVMGIARERLQSPWLVGAVLLLFFGNFVITRGIDDFWLTDTPTIALMMLGGWLYLRERWWELALVGVLAGTIREVAPLLMVALCLGIQPRWQALLPLTGLVSYAAIRFALPGSYNPRPGYVLEYRLENLTPRVLIVEYLLRPVSLGVMTVLAAMILRWRWVKMDFRRTLPLFAVVGLQLASGTDIARLVVGLFPILWLLCAEWFDQLEDGIGWAWPLGVIGLVSAVELIPYSISVGLHALWFVAFLVWDWRRRRPILTTVSNG